MKKVLLLILMCVCIAHISYAAIPQKIIAENLVKNYQFWQSGNKRTTIQKFLKELGQGYDQAKQSGLIAEHKIYGWKTTKISNDIYKVSYQYYLASQFSGVKKSNIVFQANIKTKKIKPVSKDAKDMVETINLSNDKKHRIYF